MAKALSNQAKLLLLFGFSLGLGLIFNYLFYGKVPGVSFPIFVAAVIFSLRLVGSYWDAHFTKETWATALASFLFAFMLVVRTNPFLTFLNVLASFYFLAITAMILAGGFRWEKLKSFFYVFGLPFRFLGRASWSIGRFSELKAAGEKGISQQVARGILMALPVLVLFTLLFASADLVIREYLLRIFEIENLPEALARTILVLVISTIAVGMFGYVFSKTARTDNESSKAAEGLAPKDAKKTSTVQVATFLGAIALLFFGFIVVQVFYLFGGNSALAGQDFTYAEYARRGFFELVTVALITFLLLWSSERSVMRQGGKHSYKFQLVASVLVIEVLLIIVSAFLRLNLYEEAYGFTTLRLWSHAFTIWLAVAFVLFTWKVLQDKEDRSFLVSAFVSLMLALAVMNALNPDAFIAKRNMARSAAGERFDPYYVTQLSYDAVPQILADFGRLKEEDKTAVAEGLRSREWEYNDPALNSWQSLNFARDKARELLGANHAMLRRY